MNLAEFLAKKKLSYHEFGEIVGASTSNVRFWALGMVTPGLYYALKIKDATKSKVEIKSLLSIVDKVSYENKKN